MKKKSYLCNRIRKVAQLVAYYVRDVGVGSSSLLFPTEKGSPFLVSLFYNTFLSRSIKSSASCFVRQSGGSSRSTFVPLQPVKQCCSLTSLVRISL